MPINEYASAGLTNSRTSYESAVEWGGPQAYRFVGDVPISGAARDTGNTGKTTHLRKGLVLAEDPTSNKFVEYDPATANKEYARAILLDSIKVTDSDGNNLDRPTVPVLLGGGVQADKLIGLDYQARMNLSANGFVFDDGYAPPGAAGYNRQIAKTAAATLVEADYGSLITNLGDADALTLTLPSATASLIGWFVRVAVLADFNVGVARAGSDVIYGLDTAAAVSATFQTANELIGGQMLVVCVASGKWLIRNESAGANTLTFA